MVALTTVVVMARVKVTGLSIVVLQSLAKYKIHILFLNNTCQIPSKLPKRMPCVLLWLKPYFDVMVELLTLLR